MLPTAYATPAAVLFLVGGALACFAGYRLFRWVLGINGFIVGALLATSAMSASNTWTLAVAAVVGGLVGAVLMIAAYFVGVAIVGAGVGAMAVHLGWSLVHADPPFWAVMIAAILGALGALAITRYMIIVGTAFGGAWMLILGAAALFGPSLGLAAPAKAAAAAGGNAWIVYPLDPAPGVWWLWMAWFALGVVGALVQLFTKGKKR
jgi:hypothetical protein